MTNVMIKGRTSELCGWPGGTGRLSLLGDRVEKMAAQLRALGRKSDPTNTDSPVESRRVESDLNGEVA